MIHEHVVGLGPTGLGVAEARQYYVLFGLVRFNEVDARRMARDLSSYTIETGYSWFDVLIAPLLLPLTATSRTVWVRT